MDIGATLVADRQSSKAMQPGERAFDDPSVAPKPVAGLDAAARDARQDVTEPTNEPRPLRVVRLVRMQFVGAAAAPARRCRNGRHRIEHVGQSAGVRDVGPRQVNGQRDAVSVDQQMVLAARFPTVRRVRPDFVGAPFFAATFEPSSAARDQSIWPSRPNSSSNAWCSFSHTPASCQSRSRRQHVMPHPQPISCGSICHWMPVRRTNRMPARQARSGTRGRPPSGLGGSGGIRTLIRSHSASGTSGFAMGLSTYPSMRWWAKFCDRL